MAASSLCNLFSFSLTSQPLPTKKPPTQLISVSSLSVSSDSLPTRRNRDGFVPVMSNECSSSYDFLSAVCPSLVYANTLFFKSAYNVQVIVGEDEPEEALLRRFRREVMKAGVIQESKRRRFYENKQDEKKRKTREAAKRNRRRRSSWRPAPSDKQESSKNKDEDIEEDNWELPEGDLPY